MSAIDELVFNRPRGTPSFPRRRESRAFTSSFPRLDVLVLALGLCVAGPSQAGLGERADSVARDRAALQGGEHRATPMANFDLHEFTTTHGAQVRQYVSRQGRVFATTWSGPALPDLKVVLGVHYSQYMAGAQIQRTNHHVFSMDTEGLVLRVVKLPRGLAGAAYVPALLPAGTSARDIR